MNVQGQPLDPVSAAGKTLGLDHKDEFEGLPGKILQQAWDVGGVDTDGVHTIQLWPPGQRRPTDPLGLQRQEGTHVDFCVAEPEGTASRPVSVAATGQLGFRLLLLLLSRPLLLPRPRLLPLPVRFLLVKEVVFWETLLLASP